MNLKDFAEPGDRITNFATGERYEVPEEEGEKVTVTWTTQAFTTYSATVDASDYREALGDDYFDSWLAELEDDGTENDYWVTERNVDGVGAV